MWTLLLILAMPQTPDTFNQDLQRALTLLQQGKQAEAGKILDPMIATIDKQVAEKPNDEETLLRAGTLYFNISRDDLAASMFGRTLQINPKSDYAHFHMGFLALYANRMDAALSSFQSAVKLDPQNPDYLAELAKTYARTKQPDKALSTLDVGLKHHPTNRDLLYQKGVALESLKQPHEAAVYFKKVIQHHPNSPDALYNLSVIYQHEKDYAQAVAYLEKLVEIAPGDFQGLTMLIQCNQSLDRRQAVAKAREKLYAMRNSGAMPRLSKMPMYCRQILDVGELQLFALEHFQMQGDHPALYEFQLFDPKTQKGHGSFDLGRSKMIDQISEELGGKPQFWFLEFHGEGERITLKNFPYQPGFEETRDKVLEAIKEMADAKAKQQK